MAYLYRHVRLDKNEPFYIGIGSDNDYKRANSSNQRSRYWNYITTVAPYRTEIILDDLSWEEACSKEKEFINLYGRKDLGKGSLCNFTDGGEGAYNRSVSQETKNKISESVKKNSHWKNGRKHTPESIEKIRQSSIDSAKKIDNKERGRKISIALKGRKKNFSNFEKVKKNLLIGRMKQAKKVINILTGEMHDSIALAAESINIRTVYLSRQLSGIRKNKTFFKYL